MTLIYAKYMSPMNWNGTIVKLFMTMEIWMATAHMSSNRQWKRSCFNQHFYLSHLCNT